jgi:signal transduction histidine kinase
VFLPFYRATDVSQEVVGTGIGLAVVKLLVNRMGGEISIVDQGRQGTCFQLTLPLAVDPVTNTNTLVPN